MSRKERRIGVYVCYCGGNISDYVDVERVREAVASEPGVAVARTHMFTCSDAAQQEIIEDIQNEKLDGLVIASCSPKLHTYTFQAMARRAGLNPYCYTQVNLREQDSWVHRGDREAATEKGIRLVRAGIVHTLYSRPLEPLRIETRPRVLVVGAGVAGLRAATLLSDLGLEVFLVEREREPGGWTAHWGAMSPNDRDGRELIDELVDGVKKRENVTLFTDAELVEKGGTLGDFTVKVRAGGETLTLNVGAVIVTTGFDPYPPRDGEFGYGSPGVVTLPELEERLADPAAEVTAGDVVFIHCVGSRQKASEELPNPHTYCSRYCCTAAVHTSLKLGGRKPGIRRYHLFRDMRTYGKYETLYEEARRQGVVFLRYDDAEPPTVEPDGGRLRVKVRDQLTGGEELEITADMVVLVTGMVPRANDGLVNALKLPVGREGFFNEIHPKLRPVETLVDGVFIAGTAQGPKNLPESTASSLAAVSKAGGLLMKGYVDLQPLVAVVDAEKCTWCGKCAEVCPYDAIERVTCEGREVAHIVAALCKGGGPCVPVCPEGAIDIEGFTDRQIRASIEALAREVVG